MKLPRSFISINDFRNLRHIRRIAQEVKHKDSDDFRALVEGRMTSEEYVRRLTKRVNEARRQ